MGNTGTIYVDEPVSDSFVKTRALILSVPPVGPVVTAFTTAMFQVNTTKEGVWGR